MHRAMQVTTLMCVFYLYKSTEAVTCVFRSSANFGLLASSDLLEFYVDLIEFTLKMSSICTSLVTYRFNMTLSMKIRSVITDILRGNYFIFLFLYNFHIVLLSIDL